MTIATTTTSLLRRETAPDHASVDAIFSVLDLAQTPDYAGFLRAHARALQPIEAYLGGTGGLPAWRPRLPLVMADLAALGEPPPAPIAFHPPAGEGAAWGMLYVIEGSRLGNTLLARQIPAGRPAAFVSAKHLPGEWRALLRAIDVSGAAHGPGWIETAVAGARACFARYREAA